MFSVSVSELLKPCVECAKTKTEVAKFALIFSTTNNGLLAKSQSDWLRWKETSIIMETFQYHARIYRLKTSHEDYFRLSRQELNLDRSQSLRPAGRLLQSCSGSQYLVFIFKQWKSNFPQFSEMEVFRKFSKDGHTNMARQWRKMTQMLMSIERIRRRSLILKTINSNTN